MRQDLSNDFVVGNERDHAELAAALTLPGVGKIDPSNEAPPSFFSERRAFAVRVEAHPERPGYPSERTIAA